MKRKERISVCLTEDLIEGVDYEIVSHLVIDKNGHFQTIETFFGMDQLELIKDHPKQKEFEEILTISCWFNQDKEDFNDICKTGMIQKPVYFYRLVDLPIDMELLVSLGFGVVKMLTDDASGELLFYDSLYFKNQILEDDEEWDNPLIGDTSLRIFIYFSLMDPNLDDRSLEGILKMNEDFIKDMCLCNQDKIVEELEEVFAKKKGGDNVIDFPGASQWMFY